MGELKKGKRAKQPTPAFITSTLQQEASRRLGFTATRTMRAAQTLYEGVDIAGHGTMGLITYMRTDSLRISDEAVAAAKEYIAGAYGENYICPYKRAWKTKSATAAQDAHEAIRPSVPSLTPDEVDQEHQRRYRQALPDDLEPLYGQPDGRLPAGYRVRDRLCGRTTASRPAATR